MDEQKIQRNRRKRRKGRRRRKRQRLILLLAVLTVCLAAVLLLWFQPWNWGKPVVMLDAGHGGKDPGAECGGVQEKELNLEIVGRVQKLLKENGCRVLLTRDSDTFIDKSARADLANKRSVQWFVSVHCNSLEQGEAEGIETYYSEAREAESSGLAESVQNALIAKTGAEDRGVRTMDLVVTGATEMPAVLVEVGFLTSDRERAELQDAAYQEKLAEGIAEGILNCISAKSVVE